MQLIFDNLSELERMIHAMGYVHRGAQVTLTAGEVSITGSAQDVDAICREAVTVAACETHVAALDHSNDDSVLPINYGTKAHPCNVPPPEQRAEPTKRKRRTKAEIEAEKAAQDAAAGCKPVPSATAAAAEIAHAVQRSAPLDNLQSEPTVHHTGHNDQVRAEIAAMAGLYDGADTLTHISEGRDFIAKHGFPAYNETMTLADVPANITTHTPEQASLHRAAMAWKAAQLAKG